MAKAEGPPRILVGEEFCNRGEEVYHVIEGAGTVTTGGTFLNPEMQAGGNTRGTIQNGVSRRITVGDVFVIPVGTPHTFSDIETTVVFLNIRIVHGQGAQSAR